MTTKLERDTMIVQNFFRDAFVLAKNEPGRAAPVKALLHFEKGTMFWSQPRCF